MHALNNNKFIKDFQLTQNSNIKYQIPLILNMYGTLNIVNLKNENRYILCNFIDQYSDILNIQEDIYVTNNDKSLNQLLLLAINKAKKFNLINALFREYSTSFKAIRDKKEFNG